MIDPHGLYTINQLRDEIPSTHAGKKLSRSTVKRWVRRGLLKSRLGTDGKRRFLGTDVLAFLGIEELPEWKGRTQAERDRAFEAARKRGKELGVRI